MDEHTAKQGATSQGGGTGGAGSAPVAAGERFRYVGPYGRKHRPASVTGIGYLFAGDVVVYDPEANAFYDDEGRWGPVPAEPDALATLRGPEFERLAGRCQYRFMDGRLCGHETEGRALLCRFHTKVTAQAPAQDGLQESAGGGTIDAGGGPA